MDLEQTVINMGNENPFSKLMEGVDIVINAVGASKTRDVEHSRIIDLECTKALVDAAKANEIKKFILVSSMFVTRPDTFVAWILNTMVGNCLGHKIQAENYLRQSGLDYVVIRPGGLGGKKEMTLEQEHDPKIVKPCSPMIDQGDQGKGGTLFRPTVGKLIAENLISDMGLPSKLTFEVMGRPKKEVKSDDDNFQPVIDWSSLKEDTAESVVIVDHEAGRVAFRNRLICKFVFGAAVVAGGIYGAV